MFFKKHPVEVYRYSDMPPGNWGDPTLDYVRTVEAGIQAFTADEGMHDNQMMQNVRDLLIFDDPAEDIRYGDILKYYNTEHRVAYVQPCMSGVLEHLEVYTTDSRLDNG